MIVNELNLGRRQYISSSDLLNCEDQAGQTTKIKISVISNMVWKLRKLHLILVIWHKRDEQ